MSFINVQVLIDSQKARAEIQKLKKEVDGVVSPKTENKMENLKKNFMQVLSTGAIVLNTLSQTVSGLSDVAAVQAIQAGVQVLSATASIALATAQASAALAAGNVGQAALLFASAAALGVSLIHQQRVAAEARRAERRAAALRNMYR
jgi:hypothetical protein